MRPGCDRLVAARLTFDPVGCAVWLDPPVDDDEPAQQVCSIHAATLTVPVDWTVTDRRFGAVGSADPPESRAVSARSVPRADPAPSDADGGTDAARGADAPGADPPVVVRRRRSGTGRQGLLDRAFRWTGPQRSVLTQASDPGDPDSGEEHEDGRSTDP